MCTEKKLPNIFDEVEDYIKLFQPKGWKADRLGWSDTIIDMFTQGYCFNFAKALKTTFDNKYKCTIIGTGIIPYNAYSKNWRRTKYQILKAIFNLDFNHFVVQMEDPEQPNTLVGVDITGIWLLNEPEYRIVRCDSDLAKGTLIDDLTYGTKRQFLEKYPLGGCETWKVLWSLTDADIRFVTHRMKILESKKYEIEESK
jgi:hypothetical protein